MKQFAFSTYMQQLACQHTEIRHSEQKRRFFRIGGIRAMDELLEQMLTIELPAMAIDESSDGQFYSNDADQLFDKQHYSVYVFSRVNLGQHDQREQELSRIARIARDIIHRMLKDHRSDSFLTTDFGLAHLQVSSLSYRTIVNLPDGLIAMVISFIINYPDSRGEDPGRWINAN